MTKITLKTRIGISVTLFVLSLVSLFTSIYLSQNKIFWITYVGPTIALIAFVLSIIIMPKMSNDSNTDAVKNESHSVFLNTGTYSSDFDEDEDEQDWLDEEEEDYWDEEEERRQKEEEEYYHSHNDDDVEKYEMYEDDY